MTGIAGDWPPYLLLSCYVTLFWPRVKFDIFPSCECEDSPKICPVLKHNCNVMFMALFYCDAIFSNCHALCTHNFIGICLLIIYYNNNNFCNCPQSDFYQNAVNAPHTWHIHGVLRHLAKDIDNYNGIKTDESRLLMFVLVILWLEWLQVAQFTTKSGTVIIHNSHTANVKTFMYWINFEFSSFTWWREV